MNSRTPAFIAIICAVALNFARAQSDIPHLEKRDGMTKLIVDGRPFICVAGELANSSSSDIEALKTTFPRLAEAHLNTILTVVSWDLIEPEEGKFDFSMIDDQLKLARESHVRLIFLWMASWKNGLSHYPPPWVKANQDRFPRVANADGRSLEILSTLSENNRNADAKAFAAVMRHIREVDSKDHTVIAMQVENEVGVQGSTRDRNALANEAYAKPVPKELMSYLVAHKDSLLPELRKIWDAAGDKTSGTWEEVFGKNVPRPADMPPIPNSGRALRAADAELYTHTDEIFMAWNYSRYIGYVAEQGKREYAIPMYVNAWIVQPSDIGPGDYPSGGAEPLVHDIWRAGGPAIDILAPDIYLPQYQQIIETFARNGNPAFNPETRQDSETAWNAFTQWNVLCYSPFGIDSLNPESGFARTYGFINSLSGAIAQAQGQPDAIKLINLEAGQNPGKIEMGNYAFDFTPPPGRGRGRGRGFGGRGAATAPAAAAEGGGGGGRGNAPPLALLNSPFLLIIHASPDEYYFATNGTYDFRVSPVNIPNANIAAPAIIERGQFIDGKWVRQRRLNGDDLMGLGYDVSAAAANNQAGTQVPIGAGRRGLGFVTGSDGSPAPVSVTRVQFYHYR
jgi:hypothetical protein